MVPDRSTTLDPDDTSNCPLPDDVVDCTLCDGERRDADGDVGMLLGVVTAMTPMGVACLIVCDACAEGPLPTLPIGAALHAVLAHCEHLGADLDEVTAAVAAKDAR